MRRLEPAVVWPAAGHYVVAVSGGADSMVLLDLVAAAAAERNYGLTVAHFDHGLRPGSAADAEFVAAAAARYGLAFETYMAGLGQASEAAARAARHGWLEQTRARLVATAILTAHHQDDLLETSLLNLARGTGRLGLAPMLSGDTIQRPLMGLTRTYLRTYAKTHKISWREDPTNADTSNSRNFLRHILLPQASAGWRATYLENIQKLAQLNTKVAQSISEMIETGDHTSSALTFRADFMRGLTEPELAELFLAAARTLRPGLHIDRSVIKSAAKLAKFGRPGQRQPLRTDLALVLSRHTITLTTNGSR